jgi:hypothetical protein
MNIVGLEVERICFNRVISVHTLHLNRKFTRWGGSFMGRNCTSPSLFEVDPTDNNLRIYSKFSFLHIKLFLLSHCHESISRSLLLLYRRKLPSSPAIKLNIQGQSPLFHLGTFPSSPPLTLKTEFTSFTTAFAHVPRHILHGAADRSQGWPPGASVLL